MNRDASRMFNRNKFKLGLFGLNCSGGLTLTKAPQRWDASWDNNLTATRMADAAGLEFVLPVARWHGYRGETDTEGTAFETLTWASGLLAGTKEISAFGTLHVAFINPVFAAKQVVTADHIGQGRFGLNIVSGWNAGEFEMFGITLKEHDERYVYSEEWLAIAKRIWSEPEPFDFDGRYFQLKGVLGKPKPYGGGRPLLMSAGSSPAGRAFASAHADCLFMIINKFETLADDARGVRAAAGGRKVGVFASGHMMARRTQKEAEEFYHYIVHEMGDWEGAENLIVTRSAQQRSTPPEVLRAMKERAVSGTGTFPIIGSWDYAAETFKRLSDAGLDGMAVGLVNYVTEAPAFYEEVLPRMERLGLRSPTKS